MRLNLSYVKDKVEKHLPLRERGFQESVESEGLFVIYNSSKFRMKFFIDNVRFDHDNIHIYYGRLHASNQDWTMKWQGEDSYCWYGYSEIQDVLKFLDGLSPEEAYKTSWDYLREGWKPYGLFNYSSKSKEDWHLSIHSEIWSTYGDKFFDIFDMQNPHAWQNYIKFLNEMYNQGKSVITKNKYC